MTAPDKGTPRVDREVASRMAVNADSEQRLYVTADFARTLERDVLRLAGELEDERVGGLFALKQRDEAQAQLAQVTAERDAALKQQEGARLREQHANEYAREAESALASREGWQMCPLEPSMEVLIEMAYQLNLVPRGQTVVVQFLEILKRQYQSALAAVKEKPSE